MKPFYLYWHFVLDIILTHVYVIAFLHAGIAIAAALSMSLDSLLRVAFLIPLSSTFSKYKSSSRYKTSMILRILMVIIWLFSIKQLQIGNLIIYSLIPYLIFKLVILLDSALSSDLVFAAHDKYHIDLTKSAAAQNILARASTAFAPAVALVLLGSSRQNSAVFLCIALMSAFSIFSLRNLFFGSDDTAFPSKTGDTLTFTKLLSNSLMCWGLLFQFIGNLAFSGVAFLLLSFLKLHGDIFFNEITALYAAFLISQGLVLFSGEDIIPLNKTIHVAFTMAICAILILLTSITHFGIVRLILCAGVGLSYSLLLSGVQKVVTTKLKGSSFLSYAGWSQTISRLTSFITTGLLGFTMHYGFSPSALLMVSGLLGIIGAFILGYLPTAIAGQDQAAYPR